MLKKLFLCIIFAFTALSITSFVRAAVNVNFEPQKQTDGSIEITITIPNTAPDAAYHTVIKGSSTEVPTESEYTSTWGIYPGVSTTITIPSNDPRSQQTKLYAWVKAIDASDNKTQIHSGLEIPITSVGNNNGNTTNTIATTNTINIIQNTSNTTINVQKNEPVTENPELPNTGIATTAIIAVVIVSVVGLISYLRYRKYNF